MRILVTGNMGYVGPVLIQSLAQEFPHAELIGYDTGYFKHAHNLSEISPERHLHTQYLKDIRDITLDDLSRVDAVVHLAAISNDPMGREFEDVTIEINRHASVNLVCLAKKAGVKNFVFASSCSMYGQANGEARRETDTLNPLTAYARSKVGVEQDVEKIDLEQMVFTSLRFATACGWSPGLRLDLVLNDFVASAVVQKKIIVLSDGSPWRPLIDVADMSRAIIWGLLRDSSQGGQFLAVNVGSNQSNYQVKDLAEAVAEQVSGTSISINPANPSDPRSYSVDFSLFKLLATDHQPKVSLDESIAKIKDGLVEIGFADTKFRDSNFIRLNILRKHLESNRLTRDLRWQ